MNISLIRFAVFLFVCTHFLRADNWPAWRGVFGTGQSTENKFPTKWSKDENVRWRIALPERGNSSPIVWEDKVFVTQAVEKTKSRQLICFQRDTGKTVWRAAVKFDQKELTHRTNPQCSASPVTDGRHVIVSHASAGLFCYEIKTGRLLWNRKLGKQEHIWGNGASPVIYKNLCLLNFGPGKDTYLVALEIETGKQVWIHREPGGNPGVTEGGGRGKWVGSWSTPIVIDGKEGDELLMSWPGRIASIHPETGKEIWQCAGLNPLVYTSPLYEKDIVVAMGGFRGTAVGVRAGGKGDVTKTHRLWTRPKEKQRIGSGVLHNGHVYILNEDGIAQCLEARTGKVVWEQRLRGPGGNGKSWSSMVVSGNKLYAINQSGDAFVLRAAPEYQLLAVNSLGEMTQSSMAFSDGEIFIRTYNSLWCISAKN